MLHGDCNCICCLVTFSHRASAVGFLMRWTGDTLTCVDRVSAVSSICTTKLDGKIDPGTVSISMYGRPPSCTGGGLYQFNFICASDKQDHVLTASPGVRRCVFFSRDHCSNYSKRRRTNRMERNCLNLRPSFDACCASSYIQYKSSTSADSWHPPTRL